MANFKTLMNEVSKILQSAGVKQSAAGKFIGKFAKPIAFLSVVKEGNAYVKDLPVIGDFMSWRQGIQNKIFDSTFGKIPGIGPVLTKISNSTQRGLDYQPKTRHESKARLNDPSWYTQHLGIHTNFNIPAAYPDRFPIPVSGGTPRVRSAVFYMVYNPNPDDTTSKLRAEQKFALLKGIRGLSSVNYRPIDIVNYEECVLACHAEYYGLKRALKLMQRYDLMKSAWPDSLVSQLGYSPADLRMKLAQYKGYLAQVANALHELPISGNLLNKIKFMQSTVFPDSNDATIATYYAYVLKFSSAIVKTAENKFDLLSFSEHGALEDMSLLDNIMKIRTSETYSYIIADYIGAFGAASLPKIELDWDTPFEFAPYNEDLLAQLQNTDILDVDAVLMPDAGVPDYKPTKEVYLEFDSGDVIQVNGGSVPSDLSICYNDKLSSKVYVMISHGYEAAENTKTVTAYIPAVANSQFIIKNIPATGSVQIVAPGESPELSVNLPKITNDEGLQLEYIQNKASLSSIRVEREDTITIALSYKFNTMNFCCYNCEIAYTLKSGTKVTSSVQHAVMNRPLTGADTIANVRDKLYAITLISQCDWFPSVNYIYGAIGYNDLSRALGSNAMDWNIIGVLGSTAFEQAVSYTNFSLKAPAINAEGKTIDNIQDVFNNK